tara:strand:+ start:852 stop:1028 length:177 start_codon:yes stop_codon:yes gene_type:complete
MVFNLEAFLGGAATGLSDFADETSRKKEKKADRDTLRHVKKTYMKEIKEMQRRQHMRL